MKKNLRKKKIHSESDSQEKRVLWRNFVLGLAASPARLSPPTRSYQYQWINRQEQLQDGNGRSNNQRSPSGRATQPCGSGPGEVGVQSDHRGDDRTQEEAFRLWVHARLRPTMCEENDPRLSINQFWSNLIFVDTRRVMTMSFISKMPRLASKRNENKNGVMWINRPWLAGGFLSESVGETRSAMLVARKRFRNDSIPRPMRASPSIHLSPLHGWSLNCL